MHRHVLLVGAAAAALVLVLVAGLAGRGGTATEREREAARALDVEAFGKGACRGREHEEQEGREREGEKHEGRDPGELARERLYGGCSEAENEYLAITSPNEAALARQLTGADAGIDTGRFYRAAVAQADAIADRTAATEPVVAGTAWQLVGPRSIGGRILDVVVDPDTPDTVFAAAATGGVWKSSDAGETFTSVWPDDRTQAVGALAVAPDGTLYAGTGEAGPGGGSSTYGGDGVYRSTDEGATWQHIGLADTNRIGRIVVDPADPQRIFVAGTGPLYRTGGGRGLYLSEDGGATWTRVLEGDNATTGAVDVAVDPSDPEVVYAAMWDNFREWDRRRYEGLGSGLYKSTDGGRTFTRIGAPYFGPRHDLGRIGVAVASDGTVYANASGVSGTYNGFYASRDGGRTWTTGAPPPNPTRSFFVYGWWFGRIFVDPNDPRHVYQAGVQLQESRDGGATWRSAPGSYHVDQHGMAWDPKVPRRIYLGNDGGVYRSDDAGASWRQHRTLPIAQLYGLDVSEQDPTRMVVGLQDNGSNRNWRRRGEAGSDSWHDYTGGDGQRVLIAPDRQDLIYGCYQYGECLVSRDGGTTKHRFSAKVVSTRKNWFTPIEFDPEDSRTVYSGGELMSRSTDDGESWEVISPDLSDGPGRETNPLFRNFGTLTTIASAGRSTGTIYAGTDDGNLWYTHDASNPAAWTEASDPDLPKAWVTRVEVDRRDSTGKTAYVTYSGFRLADDAPYVLRTTDGGRSWDDFSANLPKAPLNDVNVVGSAVVVASDVGVFFRRDGEHSWLRLGSGLPLAPVYELRHLAGSDRLYAGTFGRSAWQIDVSMLK